MKELHKRICNPKHKKKTKFVYNLHFPQFLTIHNNHSDSCVFFNTVDDTILMWVEPCFSAEVGMDFLNGERYYIIFGKEHIDSYE